MSKYGARRTEVDGIMFASAKEARRYSELRLLQRAGEITDLTRQPRYPIVINDVKVCTYVADFSYLEKGAARVTVEDAKGFKTDIFNLKRKLMWAVHNIEVLIT